MIPEKDFKKIQELMPICCVDIIIVKDGKYLLVKRKNEPAKGLWWVPGGRLFKNETIKECALRKAKEEVGLECKFIKMVGVYETIYDTGPFGVPVHSVNVMCLLKDIKNKKILLDKDHIDLRWVEKVKEDLNSDIKKFLENVGFKK